MIRTQENEAKAAGRRQPPPQPLDSPVLTLETAGAYLGITADAIRALLKGTHKEHPSDRELTAMLKKALVVLSERRRFIRKADLMAYLEKKAGISPARVG